MTVNEFDYVTHISRTKLKFYLDLASVTTITHDLNLDKDDMIRMLTDYVWVPPWATQNCFYE